MSFYLCDGRRSWREAIEMCIIMYTYLIYLGFNPISEQVITALSNYYESV